MGFDFNFNFLPVKLLLDIIEFISEFSDFFDFISSKFFFPSKSNFILKQSFISLICLFLDFLHILLYKSRMNKFKFEFPKIKKCMACNWNELFKLSS